jgi:hypothetical protein
MVSARGTMKEVKSNTCGCKGGGWMRPVAAGEDGKVGGSRRGDRYFTLIFHGHVLVLARPVCSMCSIYL